MMDKVIHKSRKWLNPIGHADTGAVSSKVKVWDDYVDASFSLWDCGRKVILSFDFENEKEAKQRSQKIDILIKELVDLKRAMGEAYNLLQEHHEKSEEETEEC
jgi:hypothetical protein